jgi:hypothetical protein
MMLFEENHESQRMACKPYKFRLEMRLLVFKLVLELKEVIETFSTPEFLGNSISKGSDEQAVGTQIDA